MKRLLFDFITKEDKEFLNREEEENFIKEKRNFYKNDYNVLIGVDYLQGVRVCYIKKIDDIKITRLTIEQKIMNIL